MDSPRLIGKYAFDAASREQRRAFLQLTADDKAAIRRLKPYFARYADEFAERFYAHLLSHPHTAKFLEDPELLARLKGTQKAYFTEMLEGAYEEAYFEQRLRVGEAHNRAGLGPAWYLGAYNQYAQICFPYFADLIRRESPTANGWEADSSLLALIKVIFLDIGLALETYFLEATEQLRMRNEELRQATSLYWQAEQKAQQYAKLASHEIRGSLNAIIATCDVLLEGYTDQLAADARKMLEGVVKRCWGMNQIVEEVLSQAGEAEQQTWIDTNRLMADLARRIETYAPEGDVALAVPADLPAVFGEATALREVFANLISNAVRYLDKRPGKIAVEYQDGKGHHVFCVADNGPGIAAEHLPRMFQPFFRGVPGKGLGLHFVKTIVEQHGGRVWVESTRGAGSKFYFSLPKTDKPDKQSSTT